MPVLTAAFDVVLPVIIVAGVGVVLGRRLPIDISTLNKVGLYGLTPALAFDSLMRTELAGGVGTRLVVAYLVMTVIAATAAWLLTARLAPASRRAVAACTVLGNNGNFGLPIALLALGQTGLDMAVVIFVASLVVMYTVGPLLFGAEGGLRAGLLTILRLPVVWALVLAGLLRAVHLHLPGGVESGIHLLAQAAIPIVLVQLGVQIGRSGRIAATAPVVAAVALRAVLVPAVAVGVGLALGLDGSPLASLVLAATMPIAVNTLMLAREYGGDTDTVASSVVASTLLSIPIITGLVALLPHLTA